MKNMAKKFIVLALLTFTAAFADPLTVNQTDAISPIQQNTFTPFQIRIETASFSLPDGIQSYIRADFEGEWLFIGGRTNGLHGFNSDPNNFPPSQQNSNVYVVNPSTGVVYTRSLYDPSSGLNQEEIDSLTVTSPQSYRKDATLYITGGYGVDTASGQFSTKDKLTAINLPGLIRWVKAPGPGQTAKENIRQISHPLFQVTGGYMTQIGKGPVLLVFGQNFAGFYADSSDGSYTEQVRRFRIKDNGESLKVKILSSKPKHRDPNYRRRDLNVIPAIFYKSGHMKPGLIAFSGVFTTDDGIWTVPVEISRKGHTKMKNPNEDITFKQGMNNYQCPCIGLYSEKGEAMHTVMMGGISYGYFQNGTYQTDSEIPFINQVTTVTRDKYGHYTQYLMDNSYPVILSTQSNPGNELLFGAGAHFFIAAGVPRYSNGVINLDAMGSAQSVVGYIVGGIQSTLPNTNFMTDSAASPYIFKVTLVPNPS